MEIRLNLHRHPVSSAAPLSTPRRDRPTREARRASRSPRPAPGDDAHDNPSHASRTVVKKAVTPSLQSVPRSEYCCSDFYSTAGCSAGRNCAYLHKLPPNDFQIDRIRAIITRHGLTQSPALAALSSSAPNPLPPARTSQTEPAHPAKRKKVKGGSLSGPGLHHSSLSALLSVEPYIVHYMLGILSDDDAEINFVALREFVRIDNDRRFMDQPWPPRPPVPASQRRPPGPTRTRFPHGGSLNPSRRRNDLHDLPEGLATRLIYILGERSSGDCGVDSLCAMLTMAAE